MSYVLPRVSRWSGKGRQGWNRGRCLGPVAVGLLVWGSGMLSVSLDPWGLGAPAQAQVLLPVVRDGFLADPLADRPRDPLLPTPVVDRPLSPLEQWALEQALDDLAQEADALAMANQPEAARALWMREVRLRRVLGLGAELAAIDRVAQNLRDGNATPELQLLAMRLDLITPSLDPNQENDRSHVQTLATLYTTLGHVEAAAALRRTLADVALEQGDIREAQDQLEPLAALYADWFYFPEAAATYGELVALTQGEDEIQFLVGQIDALTQAQQWEAALVAQQHLLNRYQEDPTRWVLMAELQYAMAQNHQRLGDELQATRHYQVAYTNAIAGDQLDIAAQVLRALADLYGQFALWPDVDYLYQQLLAVERQALDAYGLMETLDQLGQLHEQTGNPRGALHAYTEALALAHQLHYRQDYFLAQIQRLSTPAEPQP